MWEKSQGFWCVCVKIHIPVFSPGLDQFSHRPLDVAGVEGKKGKKATRAGAAGGAAEPVEVVSKFRKDPGAESLTDGVLETNSNSTLLDLPFATKVLVFFCFMIPHNPRRSSPSFSSYHNVLPCFELLVEIWNQAYNSQKYHLHQNIDECKMLASSPHVPRQPSFFINHFFVSISSTVQKLPNRSTFFKFSFFCGECH